MKKFILIIDTSPSQYETCNEILKFETRELMDDYVRKTIESAPYCEVILALEIRAEYKYEKLPIAWEMKSTEINQ